MRPRLALTYENEGRYPEADALLSKTMNTTRRVSGPEHPDTLYMMLALGRIRLMRRRYSEAQELLQHALEGYEKTDPADWHRYYCQGLIGECLAQRKQFAEAEPLLLAGFEGLSQHESDLAFEERKYVRSTGDAIVQFYRDWGKPDKAAEWAGRLRARVAERAHR